MGRGLSQLGPWARERDAVHTIIETNDSRKFFAMDRALLQKLGF